MSGLTAAADLRRRGYAVEVLEARPRLGGRIWTDRSLGLPLDLGASWIHGTVGNPLVPLAAKAGAKHRLTTYDQTRVWSEHGPVSEQLLATLEGQFRELQTAMGAVAERASSAPSIQTTVDRALAGERLTEEQQRFLQWRLSLLEVTTGEDLKRLSSWADDGSSFGGPDHLFPGGYHQLIAHLARGTAVSLEHRVHKVRLDGAKHVSVETDKGPRRCRAVVCTLPLGVLASGRVRFEPGLPSSKRGAARRLKMGTLNKIALRFPKRFWPAEPHFLGWAGPKRGAYPVMMNVARFAKEPVLMAFTGGDFARALHKRGRKVVVSEITRALRAMFGNAVVAPTKAVMTSWNTDPFALGSYPHIPMGASAKDMEALAEPVAGRLFFAGDATIRQHASTVHGAHLSGLREAKRVAEALG